MNTVRKDYALLALAAILFSTIIAGGQFFAGRGLSLFEISFYPLLGTSLVLLPFILRRRRKLHRKDLVFFSAYGFVGAMLNLSQFGAVVYGVPIAVVVFLLYTEPAWTLILSRLILHERMRRRSVIAMLMSLAGVLLMVAPSFSGGPGSPTGILLGLTAGFWFSLWIVMGRKHGIRRTTYAFEAFCFGLSAALWLLLLHPFLVLLTPAPSLMRLSWSFTPSLWILLLCFACVSDTIPNICFYKAIEKVKASTAGIVLLLEPLAAAIIGTTLFHQPLTLGMILGGILILAANMLILHVHPLQAWNKHKMHSTLYLWNILEANRPRIVMRKRQTMAH